MQPNGHHLHGHIKKIKIKNSNISTLCAPVCMLCVHVQSRKPGANASRQNRGDEVGEQDIPAR